MTDVEGTPVQRRSQRERKQVKPFASGSQSPNKRKRDAEEDEEVDAQAMEDAEVEADDEEDAEGVDDADDDEPDTRPAKRKGKATAPRKAKVKAKGPPPPKKPRTTKNAAPKPQKAPKPAKRKAKANGDFDADKLATDTKISSDNPLFNAIMNPSAALQSTAEDFLDSLAQSPGAAQAELINCILRACGCNDSVDADEVLDYDGVVDSLDNFTEGLKQENSPIYPLTSKLPVFKRFRASLSELISRLVLSAADVGALYTSDMVTTLQTWVVAMSSSQIRAFRHTATAVALEVETALCQVAAAVEKEAEIVGRQREGERKRRAANKAQSVREKDLDGKAAEVRKRRAALAEYLKEIVDGVFVHRYRDLDPHIRAECVRAMGQWFTHYPAHFLDASYLRYVGWVLSDSATPVRLEAVRALSAVYAQAEYIGGLMNFTARFKPRLLEMAARDTELAVRTAVLGVLGAVDQHSLLEDEEREQMCQLVFDGEVRVRKAVAGFVGGVWNELVEERLAGRKVGEKGKERAGAKALAMLLVRWDRERVEEEDGSQDDSQRGVAMSTDIKGRTGLAVEALWEDVDSASGWEGLLEMLLLDHSAGGGDEDLDRVDDSIAASAKNTVDEAWRLSETEESVLLEVLIASLRRAKALAGTAKKGEDETLLSDLTRALIKGLPRLFIKYQTDANRIANVLLIPPLMNTELYLEMRMMTAYANLWDDITKQFLSHSAQTVLTSAVASITHLLSCPSLSNTNSTKILELEDELAGQLRDAVGGREEIEVAGFNEDEVLALGAVCARVCALLGTRDMCGWMEESEGGKQSCVWDIISALVERGRLGYREEERMIEQGLQILGLHIMWKTRNLPDAKEATPEDEKYIETLREQRDSLLEKLVEYAVGTQSNTAEAVKRAAFQNLMTLHILFCAEQTMTPDGRVLPTAALPLELDVEVQYRCAGFIQAAIEQYAEVLEEGQALGEREEASESGESSGEENVPAKGKKGKTKAKSPVVKEQPLTRTRLEQEYVFMGTISTFLRAIRAGAVHVRHSAVLLAHFGRLGPAFDLCTKVIIDSLREEGMYRENGDLVVDVVTQALKESFTLVLDSVVRGEERAVALAKQLGQSFMIRGAQLSIIKRLDSQYIVQTHTNLLTWIVKRIGTYEAAKNKKSRKTAILFFRVLQPLLIAVDSRDALKIKAHMDQVLAQAKIEVPPSSKIWEPQRAYEKKLSSIMAKDKGGAKGRKAKGAKSTAMVTSDESESEPEPQPAEEEPPAPKPRPKPRPKSPPIRRSTSPLSELEASDPEPRGQEHAEEENEVEKSEAELEGEPEEEQATPRNRHQATYGRSPTKTPSVPNVSNGVTPISTRKRRRTDEDDEDAGEKSEVEAAETNGDANASGDEGPREESPSNGILFRRKRARH
ncbi:uncharacterized protein EDB91DRAFT_353827 [Suillus paluster]|uniref:uncharacterized protein n=1 Tax=Suillus paluster TaxID=48578 RepID=UPI001B86F21D|nr:uncharacterized protein EDB91DRAFT_353827 [Suillus paluster]KAG1740516.1 hypothetical protein EDB91DRAFT_353827 [Suillus paluster]